MGQPIIPHGLLQDEAAEAGLSDGGDFMVWMLAGEQSSAPHSLCQYKHPPGWGKNFHSQENDMIRNQAGISIERHVIFFPKKKIPLIKSTIFMAK